MQKNSAMLVAIVFVSFLASVGLGMLDHETESLVHLFTAEWGNVAMIMICTAVFSTIGWLGYSFSVKSAA